MGRTHTQTYTHSLSLPLAARRLLKSESLTDFGDSPCLGTFCTIKYEVTSTRGETDITPALQITLSTKIQQDKLFSSLGDGSKLEKRWVGKLLEWRGTFFYVTLTASILRQLKEANFPRSDLL